MIFIYNENYLPHAEKALASLFDIGLGLMPVNEFTQAFLKSHVATAWENGNPNYLAGKSGTEMMEEITHNPMNDIQYSFDRSAAYWCGYVYCHAQWSLGCSFQRLLTAMPIEELLQLYPALHEADVTKSIDLIRKRFYPEHNLKTWRNKRNLSQSELSRISGVNLRTIQAYEQGHAEIRKAQYVTLVCLARALTCEVSDLVA